MRSGRCLILSRQTKLSIRSVLNGGPVMQRHAAGPVGAETHRLHKYSKKDLIFCIKGV